MSKFKYSEEEMSVNKILKMNQEMSKKLLNESETDSIRDEADLNIDSSLELLRSLGKNKSAEKLTSNIDSKDTNKKIGHRPVIKPWDELVHQAITDIPTDVILEDIMSEKEVKAVFNELDEIKKEFSEKTSIVNQTDLSFLGIAIALQVTKSLIFPYVASKFNYGKNFDSSERLSHDDNSITQGQKDANNKFHDRNKKNEPGRWSKILTQTPAYDITRGSKDLGINMGGKYHRMATLGHDPILGWIFGTMNILTDIITLNNFQSFRVMRNPMIISKQKVLMGIMFKESHELIKDDYLNLPAAIFAQAQHLKSDEYTKLGLPVPILASINESFASELYRNNYDALCFGRDLKITGTSFVVSKLIDTIILLTHGLFRKEDELKENYEVRTRKILLISNSIASSSTIINSSITKNIRKLDVGSLLNVITRLVTDIPFIAKIKQEFIENEISDRLQEELDRTDRLYKDI